MATEKFDSSLASGTHNRLLRFVGTWTGETKTWFEPDVLSDTSPMTGNFRAILGGRFLFYTYNGTLLGKPFEGVAIIGCAMATSTFQVAWVDSFHNGTNIMFSEGINEGGPVNVMGHYAGSPTEKWGWRTEIEMPDIDTLVITAYNVTPQGVEAKATETRFRRVS